METVVALKVAGRTLTASRQALQKSSAYFEAMFTCGMKESGAAEIEMKDVDPELLRVLIDDSEGREIGISDGNVYDLLRASVVFQFRRVLRRCTEYLIHSMNVENAVSAWTAGDTFAVHELCTEALGVILWNFDGFAKSATCVESCPQALLRLLLRQNRLNVSSENVMCQVVKDWLRFNTGKCSEKESVRLLSEVRFAYVDPSLAEGPRTSSEGLVSKFVEVVLALLCNRETVADPKLVERARRSLALPRRTPPVVPALVVAKTSEAPATGSPCVYVGSDVEKPFAFHSRLPTLPKPLQGYVVCPVGKDVYFLCGEYGIGSGRWNRDVHKWDPSGRHWRRVGTIPSVRRHCKTAVVGKRIFLVGGFGRFRVVLDSVEIFDASSGLWCRGASVPCPTFSAAMCATEDSVFLFSGGVHRYDVVKDAWVSLSPWFPSGPFTALPRGRSIVLVPETGGPLLEFDTCALTYGHLATWNRPAACTCAVGDAVFCLGGEGRGTLRPFGDGDPGTELQVGVDGKVECCFAMPFFDFEEVQS